MQIEKALITAAGINQRKLVMQTLVDRDGVRKTVLEILIEEVRLLGIEEIGVVIYPGDYEIYADTFARDPHIHFIKQEQQLGYGHAILCGASFIGNDYFLHLLGDHIHINQSELRYSKNLIDIAKENNCSVSEVTQTRENLIPNFGTIGGSRIRSTKNLYLINSVIEKPTPTLAEQKLIIPGLRAGYYLCFFGMHVLSPKIMTILEKNLKAANGEPIGLTDALNELAGKERYLAFENSDWRFDIGTRYGLLKAQIALALSGDDRDLVLTELLELFAMKNMKSNLE